MLPNNPQNHQLIESLNLMQDRLADSYTCVISLEKELIDSEYLFALENLSQELEKLMKATAKALQQTQAEAIAQASKMLMR